MNLKIGDRVIVKAPSGDFFVSTRRKELIGKLAVVHEIDSDGDVLCLFETGEREWFLAEGIGLALAATEAAQAQEETATNPTPAIAGVIETNETPTGTEASEGTGEGGVIETNEKPNAHSTSPAAYAHPENPALTWSGRGRRPAWIAAWLADSANTLEQLKAVA